MSTSAWDQFNLNPLVVKCLLENNYKTPTDVQSHSLPYHEYKTDLILASKTGSGKTLCFGIPLLSDLMNELGVDASYDGTTELNVPKRTSIRALVLTPTRELAVQIMNHFEKINKYTKKYIKIGVIIGGLSKEKQVRILNNCPQILIATPGRLWDMLDQEYNPFLQTLKTLNYLVMDEADKMIEMGHFKELDKILNFIYTKESATKNNITFLQEGGEDDFNLDDFYVKGAGGKKISLKGSNLNVVTENAHMMKNLKKNIDATFNNDEEEQEEEEKGEELEGEELEGEVEIDDEIEDEEIEIEGEGEEMEEEDQEEIEGDFDDQIEEDEDIEEEEVEEVEVEEEEPEEEEPEKEVKRGRNKKNNKKKGPQEEMIEIKEKRPKYRRTIVLSATLASSYDNRNTTKKQKKGKGKGKGKGKKGNEEMTKIKGGETTSFKMETLMKKIEFNGKPKLIDLTQESKLPETLTEYKILCTDEEKVLYIYHLIKEHPGQNFIIFANTIPAAKRVHAVLTKLDIPAVCLHSEMQQRQRLSKLEKFTNSQSPVLVCTDVASRGLDIPTVHHVIHYQIPHECDTYVHRSGRTARIGREGTAYALVGPSDKKKYGAICYKLRSGEGLKSIVLSKLALDKIQEMVHAATALEHGEFLLQKQKKEKEWYVKNAKEAGVMIDDELQQELDDVTEEITKKRKVVTNNKMNYQKIKQNTGQKLINPNKSRSVFLDVSQIARLSGILTNPTAIKGKINNDQFVQPMPESRNRSRSSPRQKTPKTKNSKPKYKNRRG